MAVTTIELSKHASIALGWCNCKQYFWCSFIYAYDFILCLHIFCQTGATTTGRLLGLTTCLPHKDGGLAQRHCKQVCRLVLHTVPFVLSAKQGSCEHQFLTFYGMTRLGEMNPTSTDCEADALTTTPSRQ